MNRLAMAAISLVAAATAYGAWRLGAPYLNTRPEQDACKFGPVSNARYLEILNDAKLRERTTWAPLRGEPLDVGDQLRSRIEDLSKGITSPYERIAAMHAAMRASGGYLEGMWPRHRRNGEVYFYTNPEDHAPDAPRSAGADYGYYFHSNYFGPFDLIDAYSTVSVYWVLHVAHPLYDKQFAKRPFGHDEFIPLADYPSFIERKLRLGGGGAYHYSLDKMSCPAMPPPDWLTAYEKWRVH